ncbi:methylated-DNA-[protein]-cysteine S-methyltransferase [Nonlabens sp. Hel1_33_55]|uniref:methylated-DNA--[protein]-cysteine S-methyltransferase n=1 Tax=Nonlabens sp. Hel1_33_55 TaxID=1336802 RepID=UPI000875D300|nr:methylated-DNA--[protein]-cysteine S-methyltransferase [Nonlabens sp. Hel1_33_55]SCY00921.1 methylated-DNA-[protein]-cysteine S-methyltransferase [Nonlabens sp. Hel1_33_55]
MNNIIIQNYKSPVGDLTLGVFNNQLCLCDWTYRKMRTQIDQRIESFCDSSTTIGSHEILNQCIEQLTEYFEGERTTFNLPLLLCGSDFQKSVWSTLQGINYGETISYSSLSRKRTQNNTSQPSKDIGNSKSPKDVRAVAAANGANALSIIIPCHRVIGSDGSLTGYAGGLRAKEQLLKLEGIDLYNGQRRLF